MVHYRHMRTLSLTGLLLALSLQAAEPSPPDPLWDGHESIAEYAQRAHLEAEKTIDLGGGVKLELVLIPAGRFIMGTPEPSKPEITVFSAQVLISIGIMLSLALLAFLLLRKRTGRRFSFSLRWLLAFSLACSVMVWGGTRWHLALVQIREYAAAVERLKYDGTYANETPGHPVLISKAFYLGKYAVTQEQYVVVMGVNPSYFKGPLNPVEMVSWDDANAFCDKLNAKFKATQSGGMSLQLPTEAQWEYACRAGTKTRFYSGDADSDLDAVAWHGSTSAGKSHPVGGKKANAFGLYDMHGNVWQWCQDWYDEDYYTNSPAQDPKGPATGSDRVLRGGSWRAQPSNCRSANRYWHTPANRLTSYGFRCVMPAD